MRYIVAVSGGVDSVVLLDMFVQEHRDDELIVAHFDHGIRADSADDAAFVGDLAARHGLMFETRREELGADASEELARNRRYAFLRELAKKHGATIVTAHHADDMIETIAINQLRGTGWRGLAVLGSPDVHRPLLKTTKDELLLYAYKYGLDWHEDPTNQDTKYLRNSVRQKLIALDPEIKETLRLYRNRQIALRQMIDDEVEKLIGSSPYDRHLFITIPHAVAIELLRGIVVRETGQSLTRPQLDRALVAIKTYPAGKVFDINASYVLRFTRTDFVVANR
jgi:tRNA(Ile)-lysidine synthase